MMESLEKFPIEFLFYEQESLEESLNKSVKDILKEIPAGFLKDIFAAIHEGFSTNEYSEEISKEIFGRIAGGLSKRIPSRFCEINFEVFEGISRRTI